MNQRYAVFNRDSRRASERALFRALLLRKNKVATASRMKVTPKTMATIVPLETAFVEPVSGRLVGVGVRLVEVGVRLFGVGVKLEELDELAN